MGKRRAVKKKKLLSPEQAFKAMFLFLNQYYERTGGEGDLGAILGDMQINKQDGLPLDPAAWADWVAAIDGALARAD